jgi:hypothetical protein
VVGGISALCVPGRKLISGIMPMPSMFAATITAGALLGGIPSLCSGPDDSGMTVGGGGSVLIN